MPLVKVEDTENEEKQIKRDTKQPPFSEISGLHKLRHTNSLSDVLPKFGVQCTNEEELTTVSPCL